MTFLQKENDRCFVVVYNEENNKKNLRNILEITKYETLEEVVAYYYSLYKYYITDKFVTCKTLDDVTKVLEEF